MHSLKKGQENSAVTSLQRSLPTKDLRGPLEEEENKIAIAFDSIAAFYLEYIAHTRHRQKVLMF